VNQSNPIATRAAGQDSPFALHGALQRWAFDHLVPLHATVEITQRCNIRCLHCYNFDRDAPRARAAPCEPELDRQEILRVIDQLHQAGCLFLSLTGGEALVHPDLLAFLEHAARLDMAVQLLSNGVLLRPGLVGQLARFPNLLTVAISLYGATAEVHDAITQSPGSFARTWRGVDGLRRHGVGVRVKFLIMRANAHQAEAMKAQAEERGLPHDMNLTVTARHDGARNTLGLRVDQAQLEALVRGPFQDRQDRHQQAPFTDDDWACNCARANCAVTARGDVQPCIGIPMSAGNVRCQPFAEIWRDAPLFRWIRGLRLADYPSCAPCPHKAWCTRDRGAAYTHGGSYTGTDPLVCARAELTHRVADEQRAVKK
jgi:AdoMet-dependent heme synthase